ncbi:MAG: tetratricopeptide repeat protein [Bacteroidetes bacterium]|nr:tetratricopeptide repeat protein [Bacteroidota bacterium]
MKRVILLSAIAIFFTACKKDHKAEIIKEINELESQESGITPESRLKLYSLYEQFATDFPADSLSRIYLLEALQYRQVIGHSDTAIRLGNEFLKRYSHSALKPNEMEAMEFSTVYLSLAKAYSKKGITDSSIRYFEKAEFTSPLENSDLFAMKNEYQKLANDEGNNRQSYGWIMLANKWTEIGIPDSAIFWYAGFVSRFPDSESAPGAMMQQANLLGEQGRGEDAKSILKELIARYPESNFAKEAKVMLDNDMIGKSEEEQLEIILKKAVTNSAS